MVFGTTTCFHCTRVLVEASPLTFGLFLLEIKLTDWMSGIGTVIAAAAAIFATLYTKHSAEQATKASQAAADSAKTARDQTELQRPRPILVPSFSLAWNDNRSGLDNTDRDRAIRIENIGNSPAFDINLTGLEIPGRGANLRLSLFCFLKPNVGPVQPFEQNVTWEVGPIELLQNGPLPIFIRRLREYFNNEALRSGDENVDRYYIEFSLSYRALDGRSFSQAYYLAVSFIQSKSWIEPVSSLIPI